ncbi:hypothetical protein MC885_004219, partial [Smutsia gigantea]
AAPSTNTMRHYVWAYITAAVSLIILSFLLQEDDEKHLEYSSSLEEEKKKMLWQVDPEKISSEIKNHLETFKERQKNSLLQQAKYTFLLEPLPRRRVSTWQGVARLGEGQTGDPTKGKEGG